MQYDSAPSSTTFDGKKLNRKLWKGGGLIAMFLTTIVISNFFIPQDKAVTRRMLGHDFLAFYFGGTCVLNGQTDKLYDLDASRQFERTVGQSADLDIGPAFGPWWNPPFAALLFVPLAALPYRTAQLVWWSFDLACLTVALILLCRMLKGGWKVRLLVPLFVLISMPFYQAISHGQNTFFSLMLLAITVSLWRDGKTLAAGMVCGLMFYKPQLGAVVAAVLCISEGRRAILGVGITGILLLLVNVIVLPGTLHDWLVRVPQNLAFMQEANHYRWERHVTFKGFWRLTIQGWADGPTAPSVILFWGICEAILLAGLGMLTWKTVRGGVSPAARDRLIAASIISMPLLMPFYFDYDLLLISVAITVYAADRQRNAAVSNWEDRWMIRIMATMLFCLLFATMLAGHTRIMLTVPLLAGASAMLIHRGLRDDLRSAGAGSVQPNEPATPVARAA